MRNEQREIFFQISEVHDCLNKAYYLFADDCLNLSVANIDNAIKELTKLKSMVEKERKQKDVNTK